MTEVKPPSMQDLAGLEVRAVVKVQARWGYRGSTSTGSFHELDEVGVVRVGAGALADLQDHGRVLFLAGSVIPCTISMLLTLNAPMAYPPS